MFADALLDSHHQSRRGWATLTSFGVQAIAVACLLVLPLFYTQVLPHMQTVTSSPTIGPPAEPVPIQHLEQMRPAGVRVSPNLAAGHTIQLPGRIPTHIEQSADGGPLNPPFPGTGFYTDMGDPVLTVIGGTGHGPAPVLAEPVKPRALRVSAIMEGSLIHRVEPIYPALARAARVQGTVVIAAVIGRDGSVEKLQLVSGHPLLVQSAINAVNQWRYRPYVLNSAPIEVDTQVTVNFILAR